MIMNKSLVLMFLTWLQNALSINGAVAAYDRKLATCPSGSVMDSSGKFCCPSTCGSCGGYGCNSRPGGASNCCTSQISESCEVSSAPCIASTSSEGQCPSGGILNTSEEYCCPASCGSCGGSGCNTRPGGASSCCTSQIDSSCSLDVLPCKIDSTQTDLCPTTGVMDSSGIFCCPASCGSCGGSGCNTRPGGASSCCTSQITASCDGSTLPCVMSTSNDSNNCPSNGIFDSTGEYCCPSSCGNCGGSGCDARPGGASSCCTSSITESCDGNSLPCKWTSDETTDEPTSESANECPNNGILDASGKYCCDSSCETCMETTCIDDFFSSKECCLNNDMISCTSGFVPCALYGDADFSFCPNGTISEQILFCEKYVCCPASCDECVAESDCSSSPECCVTTNFNDPISTDVDTSCRVKEPPCIIPPVDDLCDPNPCGNGARCGIQWEYSEAQCILQPVCECSEVGNSTGQFCEIPCQENETACGLDRSGFATNVILVHNDVCCAADEECLRVDAKYGYYMSCFSKVRPETCDPNPCLNGGSCNSVSDYYLSNGDYPIVRLCSCLDGFEGPFCEVEN